MSIHTQITVTKGDRSIARVEIVDEKDEEDVHEAWEFHCNACDMFCTELSEESARDELVSHVCDTRCRCGYGPTTSPDLDEHIVAMAGDGPAGTHAPCR